MMAVHLTPAETRVVRMMSQSHGVVPWLDLSIEALGYYNMPSLRVILLRIKKKLPAFRYEIYHGRGIRLMDARECPRCNGTGMVL